MVMSLMALGRNEEAFSMINFWIDFDENTTDIEFLIDNSNSSEEWYQRLPKPNLKENIFRLFEESQIMNPDAGTFMAALVGIKINIILDMEQFDNECRDLKKHKKDLDIYLEKLDWYGILSNVLKFKPRPYIMNNFRLEKHFEKRNPFKSNGKKDRRPHPELEDRRVWKYFQRLFEQYPKALEMMVKFSAHKFNEHAPCVSPIDPNEVFDLV